MNIEYKTIASIDLGGTNLKGGLVTGNQLQHVRSERIDSIADFENFLNTIYDFIDGLVKHPADGIGIGVPGLVDKGVVFDVVNIACWKEINLKALLQERYNIPVLIENDANCFALGESIYGNGKDHQSMIGLTIGTGLGTGIIINKNIYSGANSAAGEIGMVEYLDHYFEYYASGQFFKNIYNTDGEIAFKLAQAGDEQALLMYEELGMHLGKAIKTILFAYDPGLIILGGSVSKAYSFFKHTLWQEIGNFPFKKVVDHLQIKVSSLTHSGIWGAAALFQQNNINKNLQKGF